MADVVEEPISARIVRLNQIFLGKTPSTLGSQHLLSRETLLDALFALFEECNSDPLRRDKNISIFIEKFRTTVSDLKKLRVNISDFEFKNVIGRGHFGDVQVVREKQTGNVYAMKILRKSSTLSQQHVAFYEEERDIMAKASSPWITQLQYAFQDKTNLYLVMEFHPGGDLLALLDRYDNVLSEDMARFYLAEMVLAIQALHNMGYVHRDIKPDNVLIDRMGHIKLADFGSAAKLSPFGTVTSTMPVGTPDYIAPEVLSSMDSRRNSYGKPCDWWSLGIVAYEMLYGNPPFSDTKVGVTYNNIMNHKEMLKFPVLEEDDVSDTAKNLISGLLEHVTSRLGFEDLSKHSFFVSIDWDAIREKPPPFVPIVTSQDDTSNFEEFEPAAHKPELNITRHTGFSGWNLPFIGFTFSQLGEFQGFDSPMVSRLRSRKSLSGSSREMQCCKQEQQELHLKVALLEKQTSGQKSEIEKLVKRLKAEETDQESCTKNMSKVLAENTGLKKLLELERSERLNTEKKALEVLHGIKEKWQRAELEKIEILKNENKNLKDFVRDIESKYKDTRTACLTLEKEVAAAKENAKNMKEKLTRYKEKTLQKRRSSVGELLQAENSIQQMSALRKQLEDADEQRNLAKAKLTAIQDTARQLEEQVDRLEAAQREADKDRMASEELLQNELSHLKEELNLATTTLGIWKSDIEAKDRIIQELEENLTKVTKTHSPSKKVHSNKQSFKKEKIMAKMQELERQIQETKQENRHLQEELLNAKDSDSDKSRTVEELQAVVARLEDGLRRLETVEIPETKICNTVDSAAAEPQTNGSPNENKIIVVENPEIIFLRAQISKLETQLEKSREISMEEKQNSRNLRMELYKCEQQLKEVGLDLRISLREAKSTAEQLTELQSRETLLQQEKEKLAAELMDLYNRLKDNDNVVRELKEQKQSSESEKRKLEEKIEALQTTCNELRNVQTRLDRAEGSTSELTRHLKVLEEQLKKCDEDKKRMQQQEDTLHQELRERKRERDDLELNLNLMREANTTMDDQLHEMETLLEYYETENERYIDELKQAEEKITALEDQLKTALFQKTAEMDKLEHTQRIVKDLMRQLDVCAVVHDAELQNVINQRDTYKDNVESMALEMAGLESRLMDDADVAIGSQRRMEALSMENLCLKEETSALITQLHSLRDTNFKLSAGLEEAVAGCEEARDRITVLENSLQEAKISHQIERIRFQSTLEQHTKLINFLQERVNALSKKKKGKLFGKKDPIVLTPQSSLKLPQSTPKQWTGYTPKSHATVESEGRSVKISEPKSPQSAAVLKALSQIPVKQESSEGPSPQKAVSKTSDERMNHNIPHRFQIILSVHPVKCASCLGTVHFGRKVARCEECHVFAHPKCSSSMANDCGLPMALMKHFRYSLRQGKQHSADDAKIELDGWVKIPRIGSQGWDRVFARLSDDVLSLHSEDAPNDSPVEIFELCPERDDSAVRVIDSVLPAELKWSVLSDLPYVFKVELQSLTTCWPGRCLYIMASNFPEKLGWIIAIEKTIKKCTREAEENYKNVLMSMADAKNVDLNCVLYMEDEMLAIGAEEGLYVLDLVELDQTPTKSPISHFGAVTQMCLVASLQIVLLTFGENMILSWLELSQMQAVCKGHVPFLGDAMQMLQAVDNICNCHLFVVSESRDAVFLCAAADDRVVLLKWNPTTRKFCFQKAVTSPEPCSCALFTSNSLLVGTDKFYEIDLHNFTVEEFLDESDRTLAHVRDVHKNTFPIAVFLVSLDGVPEEYLLCFHELGLFVDSFGQRSRKTDITWSGLPLSFAFQWPYLYVVHFQSVEICEIIVHKEKCFSVRTFVDMSNPRCLGPGQESGTVVLATVEGSYLEVVCFNGETAIKRRARKNGSKSEQQENNVQDAEGDPGSVASEFSFTSSVIQALDYSDTPLPESEL